MPSPATGSCTRNRKLYKASSFRFFFSFFASRPELLLPKTETGDSQGEADDCTAPPFSSQ